MRNDLQTPGEPEPSGGVVLEFIPRQGSRAGGPVLRCVSSGYLAGGCSCERTVPTDVAASAWSVERAREPGGSRFFHFAWRGETWIAFGLADGTIRGVYCPTHRTEREARSAGYEAQHGARARLAAGV